MLFAVDGEPLPSSVAAHLAIKDDMKITGYRCLTTYHHWGRPVGDVNGNIAGGITEVPIVLLETDSGLTGVGLGSHRDLDRIFPALDGEDPRAVTALYDRMLAHVFKSGHAGATFGGIGAFDMALWDLKAKAAGEPLWRTLGARDRFVPGYASGLDFALDDDELAAFYEQWADRGFTGGKLKGGRDVIRDIRRLGIIDDVLRRNTARPALMFDANESWNRKQAIRYVQQMERVHELDLDRGAAAPLGRGGPCPPDPGGRRIGRDGGEPDRARPVPAAARRRRGRRRADRQRLGHHALPAGGDACSRSRSADQSRRIQHQPRGPCGGGGAQPPHERGAGPRLPCRPRRWIRRSSTAASSWAISPASASSVDEAVIARESESASWAVPAGPHVRPRISGLRLTPES